MMIIDTQAKTMALVVLTIPPVFRVTPAIEAPLEYQRQRKRKKDPCVVLVLFIARVL